MLMYPLEEAITLLSGKLVAAKRNLEETIEDLEWLREQSTVMEVNFARVHNVSLNIPVLRYDEIWRRLTCSGTLSAGGI